MSSYRFIVRNLLTSTQFVIQYDKPVMNVSEIVKSLDGLTNHQRLHLSFFRIKDGTEVFTFQNLHYKDEVGFFVKSMSPIFIAQSTNGWMAIDLSCPHHYKSDIYNYQPIEYIIDRESYEWPESDRIMLVTDHPEYAPEICKQLRFQRQLPTVSEAFARLVLWFWNTHNHGIISYECVVRIQEFLDEYGSKPMSFDEWVKEYRRWMHDKEKDIFLGNVDEIRQTLQFFLDASIPRTAKEWKETIEEVFKRISSREADFVMISRYLPNMPRYVLDEEYEEDDSNLVNI